jgi:hypothetical protein
MPDRFEFTEVDAGVVSQFNQQMERGEICDFFAPLGDLRACVDDPTIDADAIRRRFVGELWSACELEGSPGWRKEAERVHSMKVGSSSRCLPYRVKRPDGGPSLQDKFHVPFTARDVHLDARAADYADQQVAKLWPRGKARISPIPLDDAVCLLRTDTNFGFPRCTTDHEANFHYYYLESARLEQEGFPLEEASDYWCVGTYRTSASGPYQYAVARALSMYSRVLLNEEKRFQQPFFAAFRKLKPFAAWRGQEDVDVAVTEMFDSNPGAVKASIDFTQFDASVPPEVLSRFFGIMASWCTSESRCAINFLAEAFMRTGIILPGETLDGSQRYGGIPSGSGWTNWVGSNVNLWVMHYAAFRCGGSVCDAQVNGDDAVIVFHNTTLESVSAVLLDELGMLIKMDPVKNLVSGFHVRFLQMEHHDEHRVGGLTVGFRPVNRILTRMTGHERRLPKKRLGLRDAPPTRWKGVFNTYRWLQQMQPARHQPKVVRDGLLLWFHDKDRVIQDVLYAIEHDLPEVYVACAMLSSSDDTVEIVSPQSFRKSWVVAGLRDLYGL